MSYKLFLDDQVDEPGMPNRHLPEGFIAARSTSEAMALVRSKGIPEFISFDHDLGEGDTSTQFIDWLIDTHYDDLVPEYEVHSENPIGKVNIISKMDSWKRSQSMLECEPGGYGQQSRCAKHNGQPLFDNGKCADSD